MITVEFSLKKSQFLSPRYTCCIGCFVLRWECHWQPHPFLFAVAVHVAAVVLNDILNDRWKNLYIRTDEGREEVKTGSKRIAEVVFTQITLHKKCEGNLFVLCNWKKQNKTVQYTRFLNPQILVWKILYRLGCAFHSHQLYENVLHSKTEERTVNITALVETWQVNLK